MRSFLTLGALALLAAVGLAPAGAHASTKRALLIGISHYTGSGIPPLEGPINDVRLVRSLLIGRFEFAPENVTVLEDAQATREGILNAIQTRLVDATQPDDVVVLHYSGHGSQMTDQPPFDERRPSIRPFLEQEFGPDIVQVIGPGFAFGEPGFEQGHGMEIA